MPKNTNRKDSNVVKGKQLKSRSSVDEGLGYFARTMVHAMRSLFEKKDNWGSGSSEKKGSVSSGSARESGKTSEPIWGRRGSETGSRSDPKKASSSRRKSRKRDHIDSTSVLGKAALQRGVSEGKIGRDAIISSGIAAKVSRDLHPKDSAELDTNIFGKTIRTKAGTKHLSPSRVRRTLKRESKQAAWRERLGIKLSATVANKVEIKERPTALGRKTEKVPGAFVNFSGITPEKGVSELDVVMAFGGPRALDLLCHRYVQVQGPSYLLSKGKLRKVNRDYSKASEALSCRTDKIKEHFFEFGLVEKSKPAKKEKKVEKPKDKKLSPSKIRRMTARSIRRQAGARVTDTSEKGVDASTVMVDASAACSFEPEKVVVTVPAEHKTTLDEAVAFLGKVENTLARQDTRVRKGYFLKKMSSLKSAMDSIEQISKMLADLGNSDSEVAKAITDLSVL